jgi:hypothetical protein
MRTAKGYGVCEGRGSEEYATIPSAVRSRGLHCGVYCVLCIVYCVLCLPPGGGGDLFRMTNELLKRWHPLVTR